MFMVAFACRGYGLFLAKTRFIAAYVHYRKEKTDDAAR